MKLIVGLGNPGNEYSNTWHNMGFNSLDFFSREKGIKIIKKKFNGEYVKTRIGDCDVILLKPLSFINLSGEVIKKYMEYFKINVSDILIISDDIDLSVGKYRLKSSGSSGGHNGLKNIELNIQTKDYKRLKIGINTNSMLDRKEYVLSQIDKDSLEKLQKVLEISVNIIEDFCRLSFYELMNKYNHK